MTKKQLSTGLLTAVVITGLSVMVSTISAAPPQPQAFAEVNGNRTKISVGTVILPAKPEEAGDCNLPAMKLIGHGGPTVKAGKISVIRGADCSVVVSSISFTNEFTAPDLPTANYDRKVVPGTERPPTAIPTSRRFPDLGPFTAPVALAAGWHRGWAKSELDDFVGIDLTYVHAAMTFFDGDSWVEGGTDPYHECAALRDGWYINWCDGSWWPYGYNQVFVETEGDFNHSWIGGSWHWQEGRFLDQPGLDWWYECGTQGSPPGPTHWECQGGSYW